MMIINTYKTYLKKLTRISLILFLIIITFSTGFSQSKKKINSQIHLLEKEISYTNELLKETQKSKDVSLVQLKLLDQQIKKQERLLKNLRQEVQLVDQQINDKQLLVSQKEKELKSLKDEYATMIMYSQKNLNQYDRMMFVFASKDFNQAFKRVKYFEQYSSYRKKQVQIIEQKQDSLHTSITKLSHLKEEKESLRKKEEDEITKINKKKITQERGLRDLKGQEKKLQKDLKKKNSQKNKLKKEIEKILAAEAKKAKEFNMTPDQIQLSKNFDDNKGKLPWPVAKGVVYSSFGEHAHPVLKGIKIRNDGIDIVTNENSNARSVFDGEVRSIISVPGSANFAVLVKHGQFFSLYSNLEEVYVKPGDQLKVKQNIGKIAKDPEDKTTKLQFQIWKSTSKLNPVHWLAK
ncbi:murein hydrolase activator EnvC [Lentimicrobium sp. L6]|uniref:murein hydrolase activator EnvC family protein n=1 Tax=Lentimicrobium sp. L6 TaxID=2735916 RepID=UPI001C12EC85|nr:peptidoglycan DD-metalloendopeptidase family protein [Lentimicrobium sp. L6]